jgi:RNA polymerase sigma factor (sigma-70 family)
MEPSARLRSYRHRIMKPRLLRSERGDEAQEFNRFVLEATPMLLRASALLCRDQATAEDLVQTTLFRVSRRWHQAREAPLSYSRRVLANLAKDNLRRSARRPTVPLSDERLQITVVADTTGDVADRLVLLDAIRALPDVQRSVIVLRFYFDLSVTETSKLLDLAEGTVKSSTSRALERLAHLLTVERLEPTRGGIRC